VLLITDKQVYSAETIAKRILCVKFERIESQQLLSLRCCASEPSQLPYAACCCQDAFKGNISVSRCSRFGTLRDVLKAFLYRKAEKRQAMIEKRALSHFSFHAKRQSFLSSKAREKRVY